MPQAKIRWSKNCEWLKKVATSNLEYIDENGFYAIYLGRHNPETNKVENGELLYIGQVYDQTIRQRLQQPHDADSCINNQKRQKPDFELFFKTGIIIETDQERVTSQLIDDIECCMIYSNQPKCNVQCKESYEGREINIEHENPWIIRDSSCS